MVENNKRFCGQCGTPTTTDGKFCTSCGCRLTSIARPQVPTRLQPPAPVRQDIQTDAVETFFGGMVWTDAKGSFTVPDVLSPEPMNFGEAVKHCFRNYANFRGRASRSEYWYFLLLYPILTVVFAISQAYNESQNSGPTFRLTDAAILVYSLLVIGMVVPAISSGIRRLHDTGRSAQWLLLNFIPFGGLIILLFLCEEGDDVPNRFGPP